MFEFDMNENLNWTCKWWWTKMNFVVGEVRRALNYILLLIIYYINIFKIFNFGQMNLNFVLNIYINVVKFEKICGVSWEMEWWNVNGEPHLKFQVKCFNLTHEINDFKYDILIRRTTFKIRIALNLFNVLINEWTTMPMNNTSKHFI